VESKQHVHYLFPPRLFYITHPSKLSLFKGYLRFQQKKKIVYELLISPLCDTQKENLAYYI